MKRFKKLLPIAITLGLVAALAMPMAALAASLTSVSGTLSDYTISASPQHVISFTTATQIEINSTITITFPAGFTGIGSIVDNDVTLTGLGSSISVEAGSGQVITATITVAAIAPSTAMTVTIGDGAAGGLNDITSPGTSGSYDIALATTEGDTGTVTVAIVGGDTTSVVTGTVVSYYTFTAPSDFGFSADLDKDNPVFSVGQTLAVATNDAAMGSAKVDVNGSDSGFLYDGSSVSLDSALTLAGTNFTGITLSGSDQELVSVAQGALSGSPEKVWTLTHNDLVVTQPAFSAVAANTYTTTLTFTATFAP